jgi:hypothetical protein
VIHVDDMMITSTDDKHIDKIINEIEQLYPGLTKIRGKVLNYIGITFIYNQLGKLKITIEGFIKDLLETCKDIIGVTTLPADKNLFQITDVKSDPFLPDALREFFHSVVAKLLLHLYLCKRTRPDILTEISFLTKRVLASQRDDLRKLESTIKYIRGTRNTYTTINT